MSQNLPKRIENLSTRSILNTPKQTQTQFEKLAQLLAQFQKCYATSKFDVGKIKVELNLPLEATAIFKNQRATRIPLQLQDRVQHLLDILTHFDIIAPVNTDSLATGNPFINNHRKSSNNPQKWRISKNCLKRSPIKDND